VVIPFGALQHTMHHSDKLSPLLMTGLAALYCVGATLAVLKSVLLIARPGSNPGASDPDR
jgi:hypothetical protein